MTDIEIDEILQEIYRIAGEARAESRAAAQLLIEKGVFTLDELVERRRAVIEAEYQDLAEEAKKRAFDAALKGRLKQ